jgi:hypothetical protein
MESRMRPSAAWISESVTIEVFGAVLCMGTLCRFADNVERYKTKTRLMSILPEARFDSAVTTRAVAQAAVRWRVRWHSLANSD